jgi:3-deoxy-D-manno-octulosonic-acid transferase
MKYAPHLVKEMLSGFSYIHTQTQDFANAIERLSQRQAHAISNLKYAAPPLPCDVTMLSHLKAQIGERPILVYASTHDGEEIIAYNIHKKLVADYPDLLSLIIPRHPDRGSAIKATFDKRHNQNHFNTVLRSDTPSGEISQSCSFYIANTLGELGLFFALQPPVIMGNSFIETPGGGHNPYEPAHFGCTILCGPSMYNFTDILNDMKEAQAIIQTKDMDDLEAQLRTILADQNMQSSYKSNTIQFTKNKSGSVIHNIVHDLSQYGVIRIDREKRESNAA